MKLPPAPEPVSCVVHGLRALGWVALFELILGVSIVATANLGGAGRWILLGAATHAAFGALLGLALDRVPGLRARPPVACAVIAAIVIALGFASDGDLGVLTPALIGGTFAWSRWRFPGQPSRKRAVFRALFFGGLAAGLLALGGKPIAPWQYSAAPADGGTSAVVIVLDTVRQDHLSTYGYERDTSPTLDALAARGSVHPGRANACWSLPGHATMLTGLYSGTHGAHYEGGAMVEGTATLQQVLGGAGYDTMAITGNPWVHVGNGTGDDFGAFVESWSRYLVPAAFLGLRAVRPIWDRDQDKGGAFAARQLGTWLDSRPDPDRPFFAFINLMEAHAPYHQVRPEDARRYLPESFSDEEAKRLSQAVLDHHLRGGGAPGGEEIQRSIDQYDGAIRGADRALAQVLTELEARGVLEETVIVVTSDHGEHFGEHGLWGHVHGLYEAVLGVPFVAAGPGVPVGRSEVPARLIDVMPSVLSWVGLSRSAWPAMAGRPVGEGSAADPGVAEQYVPVLLGAGGQSLAGDLETLKARRRSWTDGVTKLHLREGGAPILYDLDADPAESVDIAGADAERLEGATAGLEEWSEETDIGWPDALGAGPEVDGWESDALKALGYME